ncbi:hypothetical protein N9Z65_00280 [bacterium]|nr:hypothetical protein [bacterium]
MNIFTTNDCPVISAQEMCDKHVVKMIVEYAQLLSTAHRVLDGTEYYDKTKAGRRIKRWLHPDRSLEQQLYKASHINHPSGLWCRATTGNYFWLYNHFVASCEEYTRRYSKTHLTYKKLVDVFSTPPKNLPKGSRQEFAVAISQDQRCRSIPCFNKLKPVDKYKQYIIHDKPFAVWTNRQSPAWFTK